jgi:CheY-like chemotaxis protein
VVAPLPPAPQGVQHTGRRNILLVEDDLINQQILRTILEKLGHTVTIVHNGRQALQTLVEQEYDCVFMDIQMPEMDGLEATRHIRNDIRYQAVADIPIIALTAFAMTGDKEKFLQAGMNDYLSKPIDVTALEHILHRNATC